MTSSTQNTPDTSQQLALSSILVLVLLACIPPTFATGFTSYTYLRQDLLLVGGALGLVIWGVEVLRTRRFSLKALPTIVPLIGLALWAAVSSFWSPNLLHGILDAGLLLSMAAIALPIAMPAKKPLSWQSLMAAVSVGTIGAGLCGLLDAAGVGIFGQVFDAPGAAGSFDATEFGIAYYVVALPLSVALTGARQTIFKALAFVALALGGAHLALIGMGWMALIALAVGLIVPAAALMIHQQKLSPVALVASALVLAVSALGPAQFNTQESKDSYYNPAVALPVVATHKVLYSPDSISKKIPRDARFAIRRIESVQDPEAKDYLQAITLKAAKDRPLIGLGSGGWWLSQSRFVELDHAFFKERFDHYPAFRSTHQSYAKVFIEYGVLGLLLLAATFFAGIAAFTAPLRAKKEDESSQPLEHITYALWGFSSALLAGAIFMIASPLVELPTAMAVLAISLAALGALGLNTVTTKEIKQHSIATPLVAVAIASALMLMGGLELTAGFMQGKADQLLLYGYYEKAVKSYTSAHEILPAYGELPYNSAIAAWRTGDLDKVSKDIDKALALRPQDARIFHLKGSEYLNNKEYKLTIEQEKAAISRFPTYIDAYANLIVAYDMSMDFGNATKTIEQLLSLNPPATQKSKLHSRAGDLFSGPAGNPAKAIEHYQEALKLMDNKHLRQQIVVKLKELDKQIKRDQLVREGKPVPQNLMPEKEHQHNPIEEMFKPQGLPDTHGHGPGDGHNH